MRRSAIPADYIVYALEHESDLSMDNDPVSFKEAVESNNSKKWYNAMKEELKSMTDNNVWVMTELPEVLKELAVNGSLRLSETLWAMSKGIKPDLLPKVTLRKMALTIKRLSLLYQRKTL